MPLVPGTRLGPYEVLSALGVGGMGEVYRARDTRLKREVAIKVLPDAFAQDADRLARFEREAELLAALNHPCIAHIYGLDRQEGPEGQEGTAQPATAFIAMELVEGEDLAQRIARGAIPLDETLPIARQIAEALEAAHERGVIHRDLKPANIKVRADGTVKLLDFGLAKLADLGAGEAGGAGRAGQAGGLAGLTQSPTITSPALMTGVGTILGTAAYMSPEQARGKTADKRADIWAFGVVLYEMLTGARLFGGEEISDTLAAVLKTEPDWNALPADAPSGLRRLLTRCLKKDGKARMRDIGEARLQIEELLSGAPEEVQVPVTPPAWLFRQRALPWVSTAALAAVLMAVLVLWAPWRKASPPATMRLSVGLGADVSVGTGAAVAATQGQNATVSLSPDGQTLAFTAQTPGEAAQLYVRRLERLDAVPLSGTNGASSPFFSPDGQWIAFYAGPKLKKVPVTGGAVVTLGDAALPAAGGAFSEDGKTITFSPQRSASLVRVSSDGGTSESVTTLGEGQVTHRWPQVLPGGKAILFTVNTRIGGFDDANLEVQPLPTGIRKVVQRGAFYGRYLPSGHLVYIHEGTLFAAPFDLDRLAVTGPPVPAVQGVASSPGTSGAASFAVSDNGTLVYLAGGNGAIDVPIEWMDREGHTTSLRAVPADWSNLVFAPDGLRLALDISDGRQTSVWTYEWARESLVRLTLGPANASHPLWAPKGQRIVFGAPRADTGASNLYWQRADNTGEVQRLTDSKYGQSAWSFDPTGRLLAYHELNPQTQDDVLILPIEGDEEHGWKPGKPIVFLNTPAAERDPMFSPDGRWLAYQSTASGRDEVYVRPYPSGSGGPVLVSTGGGITPTWSQKNKELFFAAPDRRIMVARYAVVADVFSPEKAIPWSEGRFVARPRNGPIRSFDLHPDGNRFALAKVPESQAEAKQDKLVFVFNFFDELRRIAPVTKR